MIVLRGYRLHVLSRLQLAQLQQLSNVIWRATFPLDAQQNITSLIIMTRATTLPPPPSLPRIVLSVIICIYVQTNDQYTDSQQTERNRRKMDSLMDGWMDRIFYVFMHRNRIISLFRPEYLLSKTNNKRMDRSHYTFHYKMLYLFKCGEFKIELIILFIFIIPSVFSIPFSHL